MFYFYLKIFFSKVASFNECGIKKSCAQYFINTPLISNYTEVIRATVNLVSGLNKIYLGTNVAKGMVLGFKQYAGGACILADLNASFSLVADYQLNSSFTPQYLFPVRESNANCRFLINANLLNNFYQKTTRLTKSYVVLKKANITVTNDVTDDVYYQIVPISIGIKSRSSFLI